MKKLICITCPMGCEMSIEEEDGVLLSVEGNRCKRGEMFAKQECKSPMRMLTSGVHIDHARLSKVPVISSKELPLGKIEEVMEIIRKTKVDAPVKLHDVIIEDVLNLGVDIVASRSVDRYEI